MEKYKECETEIKSDTNTDVEFYLVDAFEIFHFEPFYIELRKKLVEKDLIETIISFPGGLFQYTGIPFVVMIISNEKRLQNKISNDII